MPQLRVHPERAFKGRPGFTGSGGALTYTDGLGVQKNRCPTKLLELSWAKWVNILAAPSFPQRERADLPSLPNQQKVRRKQLGRTAWISNTHDKQQMGYIHQVFKRHLNLIG